MNKIFYYVLAAPFMLIAEIVGFIVWEILDTGWKNKIHYSNHPSSQDLSIHIQRLTNALSESKKDANDSSESFLRQLRQKDQVIKDLLWKLEKK